MPYWPRNSYNLVSVNPPTRKKTTYFSLEPYEFSFSTFLDALCRKADLSFCVFLSTDDSFCPHPSHSPRAICKEESVNLKAPTDVSQCQSNRLRREGISLVLENGTLLALCPCGHSSYSRSGLHLHQGVVFCSAFIKLQGQMAKLGLKRMWFTLNRHFGAPRGWEGVPLLYSTTIGKMGMKPQRGIGQRLEKHKEMNCEGFSTAWEALKENARHAE